MLRRDFLTLASTFAAASALGANEKSASKKKGLGLSVGEHANWAELHRKLKPSWIYTWGAKVPDDVAPGTEFVPMIWNYNKNDERILELAGLAKDAGSKCLLGFNEPDGKDQANMKVETALDAWPTLMKTGLRLGSPAPVHGDREWMTSFMKGVKERKLRVDFVCLHWYGGTDADGLVSMLQKISRMYDRPVWLTEFAPADWSARKSGQNRYKPQQVLDFMRRVIPKLESLDCLERYAWYPAEQKNAALGPSALFDASGNLTPLGEFYQAV